MNQTAEERFWSKVDKSGDCWLWTGSVKPSGYAQFSVRGRNVYVHRFSYALISGSIPEGQEIDHRHSCPKHCVNPDHLRLTTSKQNKENQAGPYRGSMSGVRGVTWSERYRKWNAQLSHHGKTVYVGRFLTVEEADAAVVARRLELFTHNDADREKAS